MTKTIKCGACANGFQPRAYNGVYCSDECRHAGKKAKENGNFKLRRLGKARTSIDRSGEQWQRMAKVAGGPCADCGRPDGWPHSVTCPHDPSEGARLRAVATQLYAKRIAKRTARTAAERIAKQRKRGVA